MTLRLLDRINTGVLIVDVQEKLVELMTGARETIRNIQKLIHLAKIFGLPIILTEQYPKWLGPTIPEIRELLPSYDPITKMDFDCCRIGKFNERVSDTGIENIVITGVETHICVFQTAVSLLDRGYTVHVPRDTVSSRTSGDITAGLGLMKQAGAVVSSCEAVIFQIMRKAGTDEFKRMMKVVK